MIEANANTLNIRDLLDEWDPGPGHESRNQRRSARLRGHTPCTSAMTKILLVEDNDMNRDMLSRRLERKGYHVVLAVDGQVGIEMALSEAPDLVLMDMSLPVVDGWEATRRLKAEPGTKHIPVIALTDHAMSTDREKALKAGCDEYDTKPIELPRLLGKIDALLAAADRRPAP